MWGGITGTLSTHTDLQTALNAKSDFPYQTFPQNFPRTTPTAVEGLDSGWSDEYGNGTVLHDSTDTF